MKILLFILLGMAIWQVVTTITILFLADDEEKVYSITMGIGWIVYGIAFIFVKITKCYSVESQKKRLLKAMKKEVSKENPNWQKWYKKYGKYSGRAWNLLRTENGDIIEMIKKTGFDYNRSKGVM